MQKEYYKVLEISEKERSLDEKEFTNLLKKKWRENSKKWHPDRFATKTDKEKKEAEEKFKQINEAYQVLSDPEKKKMYDMFGTTDGQMGGGPDDDFFSHFGFGRGHQQRVVKGSNINLNVRLTIEELYNGGSKTVKYYRSVKCHHCNGTGSADGRIEACPHCNGTGMITQRRQMGNMFMTSSSPCPHCGGTGHKITNPCPHCGGTGSERSEASVTIDITPEIVTHPQGIMQGMGNIPNVSDNVASMPGDLILNFTLAEGEYSISEDYPFDLVKEVKVPILDCILGGEVQVKCLDGKMHTVTLAPNTKDGDSYGINGVGLPTGRFNIRGKLKVIIKYKLPVAMTKDERETLENLRKSPNFK